MEKDSAKCPSFEDSKDEQIESNHGESKFIACNSVPNYSEQEALALAERMHKNETFEESAHVLFHWLEKGECNERNSEQFHILLQLCCNRVEQLKTEQKEYQEQAERAEISLRNKFSCSQLYLNEMKKIFQTIEKDAIWCNFTQDQKENLLSMLKQYFIEDSVSSEIEEKGSSDVKNVNFEAVQPENVAGQLETKVDGLASELNIVHQKTDMKKRHKEYQNEILKLRSELKKKKMMIKHGENISIEISDNQQKLSHVDVASQCDHAVQNEMSIISLVSTILYDHQNEANITFLQERLPQYNAEEIENALRRNPTIFSWDTQKVKWVLCKSYRVDPKNL